MKKIIALIIAVFCLSSLFVSAGTVSVSEDTDITQGFTGNEIVSLSDNFNLITYGNIKYMQFNDTDIFYSDDLGDEKYGTSLDLSSVSLTAEQKNIIESVELSFTANGNVIWVYISFKSGAHYNAAYLNEALFEDYNSAKFDEWENVKIDFLFPEGNIISANRKDIISKDETILFGNDIQNGVVHTVYAGLKSEKFGVRTGELVVIEDNYYYVDYQRNSITYTVDFDLNNCSNVLAYKVTNKELTADLKYAQKQYFGDDLGFLEDDNLTKAVSDVLLILVFGIVPFLIALIFIALAIVNKTIYKRFFRAIYISALLVVVIFIALAIIL